MKAKLFTDDEYYNDEGVKLMTEFQTLVGPFIKKACHKFNAIEVQSILASSINLDIAINRIKER